MKNYNVGVIGLGNRGGWWVTEMLTQFECLNITGLCDVYQDRIDECKDKLVEKGYAAPEVLTDDYKKIIDSDKVDIVLVFSAWMNHFDSILYSLSKGKPVATEVGGAYTVEQCRELVSTYEKTKTPFMMLENCCFGQDELMVLNMTKNGVFGDIVHCDGGYMHDLRSEITRGNETRHYRFDEYLTRNCDNYPTHEIGPIAKVLDINNGNRFESLVSMSSRAVGLNEYINSHDDLREKYADVKFKQGDVVETLIKCADGSTVSITLDTSLPRYYSRNFTVRGTKGMIEERTHSDFLDSDDHIATEWDWSSEFNNIKRYRDEWEHPIWKNYRIEGIKKQGHGGMDYLVMDAFLTALDEGLPMPIDAYDAAAYMAITALSEQSIALGSQPVTFPDFTNGKWRIKKPQTDWKYTF